MTPKKPTAQDITAVFSFEMMQQIKDAIGAVKMQKIFSVGQTQILRYCRNPQFTEDSERNPIDRMRLLLEQAQEAGADDAVLAALDHIMAPLGLRVAFKENVEPDKPSTDEELLSDYASLATMQHLMKVEDAHPSIVRKYADKAKEDIEQTFTSYERDFDERGNS